MALPLPPGLTSAEVAFLCEMEMITVVPRQRLESLNLLAVSFPANPSITSTFPETRPHLNSWHCSCTTPIPSLSEQLDAILTLLPRAQHQPSAHPTEPQSPSG